MKKMNALINGELINNNEWLDIWSPINNQVYGSVPALKAEHIDLAFNSARKVQKQWAKVKLVDRIKMLNTFKTLLLSRKTELSEIMAWEVGKGIADAAVEVERTAEYIEYTIEEAKRLNPETYTGDGFGISNKLGIFRRIPKGVILAISPFNYPVNLSISKIAPSLVAGNTVVFKPATQGSLAGCFLGQLFQEAGFPAGVINVVTGRGRDIGDLLVMHKEIDLISFTGSVPVGHHIKDICRGKELVLELGGKDPALVLKDADLQKAAKEIVSGAFSYSGQRCTAIKRVLVDTTVADALVKEITPLVAKLTVGSPLDNNTIIPIIDQPSTKFVQSLIDDALAKHATLLFGNKTEGNLMWPTLIDHVTPEMRLAWEEPFGPVLPIIRCANPEEMLALANRSEFGLQASIFTKDITTAMRMAEELEAGSVNINGKSQRGPDSFPFLGIKDSGQGVQGIRDTLLSVTRPHGIVINY